MALDFSKVNERHDAFTQNNQPREKIDYTTIFWRPKPGTSTVRIVPSSVDPTYPFTEIKMHYGFDFPMPSLSNFGKQDPVEEFVKELRKLGGDDNFNEAKKFSPKTRIVAPVLVRGEEDKGVRLWNFGIQIYEKLLALAKDEHVGDFTDVLNGWDMTVEQKEKSTQNPYGSTDIRIIPRQTPLSEDASLVDKWTKEQPIPLEVYREYDYDFIKGQLTKATNDILGGSPINTPSPAAPPKTNFTLENAAPANQDTVSKFDDLFNE